MGQGTLKALLCVVAALASQLLAAPGACAANGVERVRFRAYSTLEGLRQSAASDLTQDSHGFVWIASQAGVLRFDGYEFRIFRHERGNAESLSDNYVLAVAAAADGVVWVGTNGGGLCRFSPDSERFDCFRHADGGTESIAADAVLRLYHDRRNRLWVSTREGGLQWLEPGSRQFRWAPVQSLDAQRPMQVLAEDSAGGLYLGAREGLVYLNADGSAHRRVALPLDSENAVVEAVAIDATGDVWVGYRERGLVRLDKSGQVIAHYRNETASARGLVGDSIQRLLTDGGGRLWVGTTQGLSRFRGAEQDFESWRHDPRDPRGLPGNWVTALMQDRVGRIWLGTRTGGFGIHDPVNEAFAHAQHLPGESKSLPAAPVTGMLANADGSLWLAVSEGGGVVRFDLEHGVLERHAPAPSNPLALSHHLPNGLARAADGALWISTLGGGLNRLAAGGERFERFRHSPDDAMSLSSDSATHVSVDRAGTLWVATLNGGLNARCASCAGFRRYRHLPADPDSIASDAVNLTFESRSGELWVGLRGAGLDLVDRANGRFRHFRPNPDDPEALSSGRVVGFFEDSAGGLWISTHGGGVNRLLRDNGRLRFQALTTQHGLLSDEVASVQADLAGHLWIASTYGLSRYDPKSGHVANFTTDEGVAAVPLFNNVAAASADGHLYFGGVGGVSAVEPAKVSSHEQLPRVVLTDFLIANRPVGLRSADAASPLDRALGYTERIVLRHDQNAFAFKFAAVNYPNSEELGYHYKLEGLDADWIAATPAQRFAGYTNLPPGEFTFRVRAARRDGGGDGPEARVGLQVMSAPWAGLPALSAYAVLAISLAWWVWLRLRRRLVERQRAEESLRSSEERLKLALWGSGGEMWDADLSSGQIFRQNRLEHLAVSRDATEDTMQAYTPFVHSDDRAGFAAAMAAHVKGKTEFFESTYRCKGLDGEWHWLVSRGRCVSRDAQGRALRLVGITEDISDLKGAEDKLRLLNEDLELRVERRTSALKATNQQLQQTLDQLTLTKNQLVESEKMASLGGLVAGVAHEINTPLGIGVTAASHLEEETRRIGKLLSSNEIKRSDLESFHDTALESSQLILRNLQRADKLVRSFKQVAVDQSSEQRRVIDLRDYLEEIQTSLQPALKKTQHQVIVDCPASLTLDTYPGAIYQIVVNLVMNSIVHGFGEAEHGEIRLAASGDAHLVTLVYLDNGRGMPDEVRARIFEPFFTTRRGQGGSGLGMHIVYNLVTQLMQGTIVCDSGPGQGVRFEITLPRHLLAPAREAAHEAPA